MNNEYLFSGDEIYTKDSSEDSEDCKGDKEEYVAEVEYTAGER